MKRPLITMSAITGKPTKNEIFDYLKSLKDNSIEQVMLYPRSGCELEYLSEEWFLTISHFIECAKELEMSIWLYDDFNWPSGDAGGRVTKFPEFRLKSIQTKGEKIGEISYKSTHNSGLFGEKFFPNLLSYECVDYFIRCTHEEYYKRFSEHFGTTIKGIFTDEPSVGYACKDDCIPYYDGIESDYFNYCGRDFNEDMCAGFENFYLNCTVIISNRFRDCYLSKLSSWCENHGILMTGHLMNDNNPLYGVQHGGDFLKNLATLSLPGIDEIYTDFSDGCEMSLLGTCEYASNENGAMAELFALGPVDMSYDKKRAMLYLCASFKINHYFLAISHLDMRGNAYIKDYFNNFSSSQPDFSGMKLLSKEAENASLIAKNDFNPDVYVRYPFELCSKNLSSWIDMSPFFELINTLTYNQIQWKFINDECVSSSVIEYLGDGKFILNGNDVDLTELKDKISHDVIVTDENKDTPQGIFVRKFVDGTFLAINLFGEEKEYFIDKNAMFLKKCQVYFSDSCVDNTVICDTRPALNVTYKNENAIRVMYLNDVKEAKVICECDTDVTFAIRNDVEAFLNGDKIICLSCDGSLPQGMKNLYKYSKKILLKKGVNVIKAENDFKYLPSVILIGDFTYEIENGNICTLRLKKRKKVLECVDKIADFGVVEFECSVDIPSSSTKFEVVGADMLTECYVENISCGMKAFTPYIFDIDKKYQGKSVNLKIVQYSSLAPIFGDVDYWDKNVITCGWRGTPSTENKRLGIDCIKFLK